MKALEDMHASKVKSKTEDSLQPGIKAFPWWRNGALPHALLLAKVEEKLEFRLWQGMTCSGLKGGKWYGLALAGPILLFWWPVSFKSPCLWLVNYWSWLELCHILSFIMFLSNVFPLLFHKMNVTTELKKMEPRARSTSYAPTLLTQWPLFLWFDTSSICLVGPVLYVSRS